MGSKKFAKLYHIYTQCDNSKNISFGFVVYNKIFSFIFKIGTKFKWPYVTKLHYCLQLKTLIYKDISSKF